MYGFKRAAEICTRSTVCPVSIVERAMERDGGVGYGLGEGLVLSVIDEDSHTVSEFRYTDEGYSRCRSGGHFSEKALR